MKNKKFGLAELIACCAVCVILTFSICFFVIGGAFSANRGVTAYDKVREMDGYVRSNYMGTIDEKELNTATANGYIAGLDDKYARYLSPEQYEQELSQFAGHADGMGVFMQYEENSYPVLNEVYENSPADLAGLEVDDFIISIDGIDVFGKSDNKVVDIITKNSHNEVNVVYQRNGVDNNVTLILTTYDIKYIRSQLKDDIGYIKILSFNEAAASQFQEALSNMQEQGAKALVFDLRNNGGGTLTSVCQMLDSLLPEGSLGTQTTANGNTFVFGWSDSNEINLPMIALTNQNTASGAELFTCDLKDYNKAKQVGTTTYGKGVFQENIELSDHSCLAITSGYYNPAKSSNYNGQGLTPDEKVELSSEQEEALYRDRLALEDDPQYQKAVEIIGLTN